LARSEQGVGAVNNDFNSISSGSFPGISGTNLENAVTKPMLRGAERPDALQPAGTLGPPVTLMAESGGLRSLVAVNNDSNSFDS